MNTRAEVADAREKRASAFNELKAINDKALEEKRDLTSEEAQEYDRIEAEIDKMGVDIRRADKRLGFDDEMGRTVVTPDEEPEKRGGSQDVIAASDEYRSAFDQFLRCRGRAAELSDEQRKLLNEGTEQRAPYQVGTNSEGGFTVPIEFHRQLVESERDFGVMRQLSRSLVTGDNGDLQIPALDTRSTAAWTAEEAAFTESESVFKQVILKSYKAAAISKISDELLLDSAFDLLAFLARDLGEALGILENTSFVTGASGSTTTPEGIVKKATVGKTFASNAAITADELIDLYHSVLSAYRRDAAWIMKDSTVQAVRKLKLTDNAYIWQPGLQAGQPDLLLGRPLFVDPDMPAIATVAESVVFGDVGRGYWIRDVEGISIKVLNELYSASGQVGFRAHRRTDGDLVDTAAVKIGKHPV